MKFYLKTVPGGSIVYSPDLLEFFNLNEKATRKFIKVANPIILKPKIPNPFYTCFF